ncbi:MAG: 2-phospho-L-lactate transferase [Candidatus Lokiarchaeum sp. GC14_75]|nr:MAG: 2-phospho-L-lactate transferase [Candidatus Lokiarchaeum sp. GC14_75]
MNENHIIVLAGGVGAAKLIEGLVSLVKPNLFKIIVNTGDDIELFGLKICPDLDIITYTLANLVDKKKGWGFVGDTFNSLSILKRFYDTGWFNAGDKDLAVHIYRTDLFKQGFNKAQITQMICKNLGVIPHLIPMCNESVETFIETPSELMQFEKYFIKHRCEPEVLGIEFKGIEKARPVERTLDYIKKAERIIICPSNPIVSIGTILQVEGIREALLNVKNKVYGVSPIIQGATVKGPADKLMKCLGLEISCVGVAKYYQDILGHFIIDNKDFKQKSRIEKLGIKTYCFDTLMTNITKKRELARFLLELSN